MKSSTLNLGWRQPLTLGRRDALKLAGLAALGWMSPLAHLLARAAEQQKDLKEPPPSLILLWLAGGPSQLETFDPKPGTPSAGGTRALDTAVKGVQLAEGFDRLAAQIEHVSLIRSVVSKEGDHERGTYTLKTGHRPEPTVIRPSLGALAAYPDVRNLTEEQKKLWAQTEIPRHVAILPGPWPGRGGILGDAYDAFKCYDPLQKIPDVTARVPSDRDAERVRDLDVIDRAFARGRLGRIGETRHADTLREARLMMSSEQLQAFDITREPARLREAYGDTPFGRSCLAARRLIEVGVRCVEVTLNGWDTHVDNHKLVRPLVAALDPAFAALLADLKERDLLRRTVVLCLGEFGRTPRINPLGGRDHWPNGFSVALAGGGLRGGLVIGETDPEGKADPSQPVSVADVHATVMQALGIDPRQMIPSPMDRPIRLSDGQPIAALS
jgi:hypothetical protein